MLNDNLVSYISVALDVIQFSLEVGLLGDRTSVSIFRQRTCTNSRVAQLAEYVFQLLFVSNPVIYQFQLVSKSCDRVAQQLASYFVFLETN